MVHTGYDSWDANEEGFNFTQEDTEKIFEIDLTEEEITLPGCETFTLESWISNSDGPRECTRWLQFVNVYAYNSEQFIGLAEGPCIDREIINGPNFNFNMAKFVHRDRDPRLHLAGELFDCRGTLKKRFSDYGLEEEQVYGKMS